MDEVFLILLGIAWAIGTPILAIVALARTSRLRSQNERLAADLAAIQPIYQKVTAEWIAKSPQNAELLTKVREMLAKIRAN